MRTHLEAADLIPLLTKLSRDERVKLAQLALAEDSPAPELDPAPTTHDPALATHAALPPTLGLERPAEPGYEEPSPSSHEWARVDPSELEDVASRRTDHSVAPAFAPLELPDPFALSNLQTASDEFALDPPTLPPPRVTTSLEPAVPELEPAPRKARSPIPPPLRDPYAQPATGEPPPLPDVTEPPAVAAPVANARPSSWKWLGLAAGVALAILGIGAVGLRPAPTPTEPAAQPPPAPQPTRAAPPRPTLAATSRPSPTPVPATTTPPKPATAEPPVPPPGPKQASGAPAVKPPKPAAPAAKPPRKPSSQQSAAEALAELNAALDAMK